MCVCVCVCVCVCARARAHASVNRGIGTYKPEKGHKDNDNNIIRGGRMQRTRTDVAVVSSESRQTLTGVAVDAVHTGAAILTGKGDTLVDG